MQERNRPLKFVVAGQVDDGKSTLIGRLLFETNALSEQKISELETLSAKRNMPFEWSFVLDAFQAERNQAVTIDTTRINLKIKDRDLLLIDVPGHTEFLKNMVTGAADIDSAILIIDVLKGIQEQTKRHTYFLKFFGVRELIVVINKMDLVSYSQDQFNQLSDDIKIYLQKVGIKASHTLPISARHGVTLTCESNVIEWYKGNSLLKILNDFEIKSPNIQNLPFRFPVQDVYKFDEERVLVGRVESGTLRAGDKILFLPSSFVSSVESIKAWNSPTIMNVSAGESIAITLSPQIFVERGELAVQYNSSSNVSSLVKTNLFWVGESSLRKGNTYKIKFFTKETYATVRDIIFEINLTDMNERKTDHVSKNNFAQVMLELHEPMPFIYHESFYITTKFVLLDKYDIVAGGLVLQDDFLNGRPKLVSNDKLHLNRVFHRVSSVLRNERNGHRGGILWFTGLPAAGKSTLAMAVEQKLFQKKFQVFVLDGDNLRLGLNANLGFSIDDRRENIRRVGEVSALFAEAGFICITALISPYKINRENVRSMVSPAIYHEIYIKSDLNICEGRDPKGHYKMARRRELKEFTGISAPYEEPDNPELIVDTNLFGIEDCAIKIVNYIVSNFSINHEKYFEKAII